MILALAGTGRPSACNGVITYEQRALLRCEPEHQQVRIFCTRHIYSCSTDVIYFVLLKKQSLRPKSGGREHTP